MSDTQRVPFCRCPHCGYGIDATSVIDGTTRQPRPGDISVCIGCGEALQFGARLNVTKITAASLASLDPDEADGLRRAQQLVRLFLSERGVPS